VPVYEKGGYLKVEFEETEDQIGKRMWVRVESCDDRPCLGVGVLDHEPANEANGKPHIASQIAVSYNKVRERSKPSKFGDPS